MSLSREYPIARSDAGIGPLGALPTLGSDARPFSDYAHATTSVSGRHCGGSGHGQGMTDRKLPWASSGPEAAMLQTRDPENLARLHRPRDRYARHGLVPPSGGSSTSCVDGRVFAKCSRVDLRLITWRC